MRVSFNIDPVFFKFKNDEISQGSDVNTIEGVVLKTYIDKHNLSVDWIDEQGLWGSKNENGTFNGVVGRVRKTMINSKTFVFMIRLGMVGQM